MIGSLAESLDFIELSADDAVAAVNTASAQGVRSARIHDLMHATAAQKYGATVLYTLDEAGFSTLKSLVRVQAPRKLKAKAAEGGRSPRHWRAFEFAATLCRLGLYALPVGFKGHFMQERKNKYISLTISYLHHISLTLLPLGSILDSIAA